MFVARKDTGKEVHRQVAKELTHSKWKDLIFTSWEGRAVSGV